MKRLLFYTNVHDDPYLRRMKTIFSLMFLRFGSEIRHEYIYQVLADKDVERVLPSVEELLKKSFHQSGLKLTEV